MRRVSEAEKQTIWDMREAGVPVKRIARHLGRQPVSLRKFLSGTGGKRPSARERSELRLSLDEREEMLRGLAAGHSIRAIATTPKAPPRFRASPSLRFAGGVRPGLCGGSAGVAARPVAPGRSGAARRFPVAPCPGPCFLLTCHV